MLDSNYRPSETVSHARIFASLSRLGEKNDRNDKFFIIIYVIHIIAVIISFANILLPTSTFILFKKIASINYEINLLVKLNDTDNKQTRFGAFIKKIKKIALYKHQII